MVSKDNDKSFGDEIMTESKLGTLLISIKIFSSTMYGKVSSIGFVRYQADKSNFFTTKPIYFHIYLELHIPI